jgi:nicotinate-nucleotide adenylyltransferase
MRVAMFGGTFDPIHIGHLFIADEVKNILGYDRVVFVPTYQPPHKTERPQASGDERVQMLRLALNGREDMIVDSWELERAKVTYTIETVRYLYETMPIDGKLGLIIGDDLATDFDSWKEADELIQSVDLIVAHRKGEDLPRGMEPFETIDNSPMPVSSSEIRERVRLGKAFRYLVTESVYVFIQQHDLYRR